MDEATIYIVEDDAAVRVATRRLLRPLGHPVREFASAEEFLAAAGDARGCLVLDLSLPGMNGLELQERLAARGSDLPIIFMTSHFDAASQEAALARGAIAFLRKPFGADQLHAHVRTAMASSNTGLGVAPKTA
jgi:FixJ family two-component response regulator